MTTMLAPAIAYPFFFLVGLALGSFGNVVAYRLPAGKSLGGRSRCPHCGRALGVWELFPLLSWVFLRARCRGCKQQISVQYPLVELTVALLFTAAGAYVSFDLLPSLALGIALWSMLLIAIIDVRTQTIPDALTLVLALAGGACNWLLHGMFTFSGALTGLGCMGLLWAVSRGTWTGSGDVLLAAALGLLLGHWPFMVLALMASYILGAAVAIVLLVTRAAGRRAHIPFGPFLIAGALIAFFLGDAIFTLVFPY